MPLTLTHTTNPSFQYLQGFMCSLTYTGLALKVCFLHNILTTSFVKSIKSTETEVVVATVNSTYTFARN